MKSIQNRYFTSAARPCLMLLGGISCAVLAAFLFSCSSVPLATREPLHAGEGAPPPHYSMVFIIHGDGDYSYHDIYGQGYRADEEVLAGAIRVAEQNQRAEVFIFHQKPRRHTLFFFPRRDGTMYYYRHGKLLANESYWRDQGPSRFDPEAALYRRFRAAAQPLLFRSFLYLGHQIPEFEGAGYDASYSQETFTVHDLAAGVKRFTHDSAKFDLVVLSTCFGGTPHTIGMLAPYARTIVASPGDLHLSYFNLEPFEQLEAGSGDGDTAGFAKNFARKAFERLTENLQTAVTVAVYDPPRVQEYVHAVDSVYTHTLAALKGKKPVFVEYGDCADDSSYVLPGMSEGVDIFYRPPQFGRLKHKQSHSGWGCPRLRN